MHTPQFDRCFASFGHAMSCEGKRRQAPQLFFSSSLGATTFDPVTSKHFANLYSWIAK
jgi:hypothetical protein